MSEQPVADRSVRLAWAADTDAIGAVQARAWTASYAPLLPAALLADVDAPSFAAAWREAVTRPPSARHRVLVALEAGRVVGFAATAPSEDPDTQPGDGEVVAFHVDPAALGEGHGSRLLAAVADTLRADGFTRARMWLVVGDDAMRGFLEPAGWAPDTAHRTLDLTGDGSATLRQVRLHTSLADGEEGRVVTFAGIPVEALDFYEDLENDNTKSFWAAHKHVYEQSVRDPMRALADELSPEFGDVRFFRPYRDVRFAADKSPYKTQQGVSIGGHYLHVGAAGLFVAAGYYQMAPDQVARYRVAVDDSRRGSALTEIVSATRAAGYVVGGEALKTRPRGYDADHPRIELLRQKALVAWLEAGAPDWLHTPAAATRIAAAWRDLTPLKHWLDDHVGPSDQPRR